MTSKEFTVNLSSGENATPAAMIIQIASRYESIVHIEMGTVKVNAKSLMGMMTLPIKKGEKLTIIADGSDEKSAIDAIADYIK